MTLAYQIIYPVGMDLVQQAIEVIYIGNIAMMKEKIAFVSIIIDSIIYTSGIEKTTTMDNIVYIRIVVIIC